MSVSSYSTCEYSSSSVHYQDFNVKRIVVKAKHRSVVPTVSNLLLGVVNDPVHAADSKASVAYDKEYSIEKGNMEEKLPVINEEQKIRYNFTRCSSCNYGSHRTEDVFIRENENGTRSHYCPLDPELYGDRDENEDYPDIPMKFDIDLQGALLQCSTVSGNQVSCHTDQKTSSSKSQGSENEFDAFHHTDSSTGWTLLENLPESNESFLQNILQTKSPSKKLSANTLEMWACYSSDEDDFYPPLKESKLPYKPFTGDESDMEEFRENSAKCEKMNLNSCYNNEEDDLTKLLNDSKYSKKFFESDSRCESFIKFSKAENPKPENSGENEQVSSSNMQNKTDNINKKCDINSVAGLTTKDIHSTEMDSKNERTSNLNLRCANKNDTENFQFDSESSSTPKDRSWAEMDSKNKGTSNLNQQNTYTSDTKKIKVDSERGFSSNNLEFAKVDDKNEVTSNLDLQDTNSNDIENFQFDSESSSTPKDRSWAEMDSKNEGAPNLNQQDKYSSDTEKFQINLERNSSLSNLKVAEVGDKSEVTSNLNVQDKNINNTKIFQFDSENNSSLKNAHLKNVDYKSEVTSNLNGQNKNINETESFQRNSESNSTLKNTHSVEIYDKSEVTSNLNVQDKNINETENFQRDSESNSALKNTHSAEIYDKSEVTSNLNAQDKNIKETESFQRNSDSNSTLKNTHSVEIYDKSEVTSNLNVQDKNISKTENFQIVLERDPTTVNIESCTHNDDISILTINLNSHDAHKNEKEINENDLEGCSCAKHAHHINNSGKIECVNSDVNSVENFQLLLHYNQTKDPIEIIAQYKNKGTLTMEPVIMNVSKFAKIQPDCKGESHSETPEPTNKMPVIENRTLPNSLESNESQALVDQTAAETVFQTVLTEEEKTRTKPRNKLTKFFQSFKKKFNKTKKP